MSMPSVEVPEAVLVLLRPILEHVESFGRRARGWEAIDFALDEGELMRRVAAFEVGCIGQMLEALDPVAPRVEVKGRVYRRLNLPNNEAPYFGVRGATRVRRALYRDAGVKNGPTIVPMELRAGIVEGHLTPAAAQGIAALGQAMPSREADLTCQRLGVLPYSRSEHFRSSVGIGVRWGEIRELYEDELVEKLELLPETAAASVSVDRVSLPMAEPRPRTAEDIAHGVEKPIHVVFRMAFSAVLTTYDGEGEPLACIRYAHVPTGGAVEMEDALREDLDILLRRRPDLKLVALADGAPEMQHILDRATEGHTVTAALLDIWHVLEHLGEAARSAGVEPAEAVPRFRRMLLASDDAITTIEGELNTWALRFDPEKIPEALHAALTYVENNRDRMRYATVYAARLPIGSGTVEATGKTIVETRMRRAGARWDEAGAQPILALRALSTSSGTRWADALAHVVDSYKSAVKQLQTNPRPRGGSH
jgi:hypothetical protein